MPVELGVVRIGCVGVGLLACSSPTPAAGDGEGETSSSTTSATSPFSSGTAPSTTVVTPSAGMTGGEDDDGDGPIFDVSEIPDVPPECGGGAGVLSFSYIWIANSDQGTLSKIDTTTLVEVGRYLVHPGGGAGLPSRTSVNLSGDVAVANRTGGVAKIYASKASCEESNGQLGIQTSTGAGDIRPWGEDECLAWYTDMSWGSQRPIAWTHGAYDEASCSWKNQKVWTTGTTIPGRADVILLDGDDGVEEDRVTITELEPTNDFGGYGAVVDSEGNLWFNEMYLFGDLLLKVDIDDLSYELFPTGGRSGYGIAMDLNGRIWTCGSYAVNRYDPVTEVWNSASNPDFDLGGCMVDGQGRLWVSGSNYGPYTFKAFDTDTMAEVESFDVPEHLHGVSIDFQGYVWGVGGVPGVGAGERAYRIDPETGEYDTVEGLVGAYTYSDMTGFALVGSTPPPR